MESVGEALLTVTLSTIIDNLSSSHFLRYARQKQILAEIKTWQAKLSKINAVLEDAEEKQSKSEPVKIWLRDLRDLAYDVEDILDEFNAEALRRKMTARPQSMWHNQVRAMVPCLSSTFSPCGVKFNVKIGSKLSELSQKLEEIVKDKEDLSLRENVNGKSRRTTARRISTTSLVDESRIYGRENDKEAIVELLLGNRERGSNEFIVVPIVGMGGIGKTTLAQLVYNDDRLKTHFDFKAWVCVSKDFDVNKITKTILQSVTAEACDINDLNLLQEKLKHELLSKKYFIVLDDIWNENDELWEVFSNPFRNGIHGSKLLVTTRNDGVVSTTAGASAWMYRLKGLSDVKDFGIG